MIPPVRLLFSDGRQISAQSPQDFHTLVDDVPNPPNWIKPFDPEADKCSSFALNFCQKHLLWRFLLSTLHWI